MNEVKTGQKFHITLGHQTVIGQCTFFSSRKPDIDLSKQEFSKGILLNTEAHLANLDSGEIHYFEDDLKSLN